MNDGVKCYLCGFCCTQSACGYGKWNYDKHQCEYLTTDNKCSKYDEIVAYEKSHPYLKNFQMMGCGCSSPMFNERRQNKMKELVKEWNKGKDIGWMIKLSEENHP